MKIRMVSVGVNPCAGLGVNTIRKAKPEYRALRPGDEVQMDYYEIGDEPNVAVPAMTEYLEVAAVTFCSWVSVLDYFLENNHGFGLHRGDAVDLEAVDTFFRWTYGEGFQAEEYAVVTFK